MKFTTLISFKRIKILKPDNKILLLYNNKKDFIHLTIRNRLNSVLIFIFVLSSDKRLCMGENEVELLSTSR